MDLVAHQLREQINALDEKSIAVQEKWHQKAQYSDEKVLRQLFPKTQQDLLSVLAPLMQWLDVRGQSDAMRFDMDIGGANCPLYQPGRAGCALAGHRRKSGAPAAAFGAGPTARTADQSAS